MTEIENVFTILDGRCHICLGHLTEMELDTKNMGEQKRVICFTCKATADSSTYAGAYLKFSKFG